MHMYQRLTQMDSAGKEDAKRRASELVTRGTTNLWAGLEDGLAMAKEGRATRKGATSAVMLLTDGTLHSLHESALYTTVFQRKCYVHLRTHAHACAHTRAQKSHQLSPRSLTFSTCLQFEVSRNADVVSVVCTFCK